MNHPLRMMMPVTTTPTTIYLEGRRLPVAWLLDDGRVIPIVRGGADETTTETSTETGTETASTETTTGTEETTSSETEGAKVTMTQAELDALIEKEKGRATKAEAKRLADEKAKGDLTETDRLKAEKAEADQKAADALSAANARIVKAEAKVLAVAADVDPGRVDSFLKTIDLTDIEVNDTGDPDPKAINKVITAGLAAIPEFKKTTSSGRSGGDFNGTTEEGRPTDLKSAVAAQLSRR